MNEINEDLLNKKKEIVDLFLEKGVLLDCNMLEILSKEENINKIHNKIKENENLVMINEGLIGSLLKDVSDVDNNLNKDKEETKTRENKNVKILFSYNKDPKKRVVSDFVNFFKARFKSMEAILRNRRELSSKLTSINKLLNKNDREEVALICIVKNKQLTKNGNYIIDVEDLTGEIKILVNKTRTELFSFCSEIVEDEIIGVVGVNGDKIIFANNIVTPDIPLHKEFKRSPNEDYALFLSDLHIGSKNFLYKEFNKFLKWINGVVGNEIQKNIASKIKYVFISGDLVDGVGIYPGQEEELDIKDICKQYDLCAQLLNKIPKNIEIIIIPGNHDATRIAEPQLPIYKDVAMGLYEMPNVTIISNPGSVNVGSTKEFTGFDVLLYHGYSFIYYADKIDSIRSNGGVDRPDLIMKFLLQKRHLAPSHKSSLYIPDSESDSQIINKIPDFLVTGHIHKASVSNYRNITMICGSCWQSITSFEEKMGLKPEPGRVPIVNLKTRECKIMKFIEN